MINSDIEKYLPRPGAAVVAIPAPGKGPGFWAGGPSAVAADGGGYLAYRLRRPVGHGRGYANAIAVSRDGARFEPVAWIGKDEMDAESLERPALVRLPDGRWRIYISCATTGTKHWRGEAVGAADPPALRAGHRGGLPPRG